LSQVPLNAFKDVTKGIFKHFRQMEEVVTKVCEAIETET